MKKATRKHGLKLALVATGIVALVPTVYGQGIGLQTLDRMLVASPQTMERGKLVFDQQCATCHGEEGRGGAPLGERMGAQGFVGNEVEQSGLYSIYSIVAYGTEAGSHPVFENLFYQDQWAVSHYTHRLIENPNPDSPEVVARVREIAEVGLCDPEIREGITAFLTPESDEQLTLGEQTYQAQCVSCHGQGGLGDGPAGAALGARNFQAPTDEWTNGTSPIAIFNTLKQGITENGMPSYGHLDEDTIWALTHYVRESFIPDENRQEVTEAQIEEGCRALSAPARPPSIPVDRAMEFLAQDQDHQRFIQLESFGAPVLAVDANADRGEVLFSTSCASCHGDADGASKLGPFGAFPPFFYLEVRDLVPASAGGTYQDFAARTIGGAHGTLPVMTNISHLSEQDWKDLQAFVARFEGQGSDRVQIAVSPSEAAESDEARGEDNVDNVENGLDAPGEVPEEE